VPGATRGRRSVPGLGQGLFAQGAQPAVELDRQTVGAQTMDHGVLPVLIGFPGVFVAALIGVTVPGTWLATYSLRPLEVIAIALGAPPTLIALPGVLVAIEMGVTEADAPLVTYSVFPFGLITLTPGSRPTLIGFPGLFVAMAIGTTVPPVQTT